MTTTRAISYELKTGHYRTIRIAYSERDLGQMGPRQFSMFRIEGTGVRISWDNLNGLEAMVDEKGGVS